MPPHAISTHAYDEVASQRPEAPAVARAEAGVCTHLRFQRGLHDVHFRPVQQLQLCELVRLLLGIEALSRHGLMRVEERGIPSRTQARNAKAAWDTSARASA